MSLVLLVKICLLLAALLVGVLAWLFWTNPEEGFRQSTHRPEQLPYVMADRYTAVAIIALGLVFFGTLEMIAVFFVAAAVMGLADGAIYARAGLPHWKHTASGLLALVALALTLFTLFTTGKAA